MPAAGSSYAGAVLLDVGDVGTFDASIFPQAFYMTPTETGSYHFHAEHVSGANGPYVDVYRLTEGSLGAFSWDTWVGWCGDSFSAFAAEEDSWVEMIAGEIYVIDCYDIEFAGSGTYTIQVDGPTGPANDRVVNAYEITAAESGVWIAGTTFESSEEEYEFDNILGNQQGSVWYKVVHGGPGDFVYGIRSLTPGWIPYIDLWHGPGVNGAGTVNDTSDLESDIGSEEVGDDDDETPPNRVYDQNGTAGVNAGDLSPIEGGETFYLQVTGWNNEDASNKGDFEIFATVTPPIFCLDCEDYINPSSPTATIVSGAVREDQGVIQSGGFGTSPAPFGGFIGDQVATLIIPGEDILAVCGDSTPGFYAVSIKHKNDTQTYYGGLIRNGQPLWPGAIFDDNPGSTPISNSLTMKAGSAHPNELDMVRALPVQAGDVIEVVLTHNDYGDSQTADFTQICFQRLSDAVEGPAYSMLDVPDFPLGMSLSDLGTNDQQGDLIVGKAVAPTFTGHRTWSADMCVTDDGTVWVLHMQQNGGSGGTVTGPVLHYWNGSAWVLVSDDIEGLGTKRAAPSSSLYGPSTLSMDTDGEDIWVCYGVDAGATLIGGGRNTYIKVRKYDVSANSWSTVGSPFHGINSNVGNAVVGEYTRAECAQFGDQPTIRVSPAGVPWVGFTDYEAAIGYEAEWPIYAMMPYVARWTGSTWDVQRLPLDPAFSEPTGFQFIEAESVVASGTSTSYLGRSCVQHAQTTYAADTISFVPPAGRWCFVPWVAKDYISGASMGLKFKWYHNGSPLGFSTDDGASGNTLTDIAWTRWTTNQGLAWVDCDGVTDTISLRLAKTGAGTGNVYVDKVMLIPAEVYVQGTGFGISSAFVDDGQPHVGLFMHRVGENGLGENPGALHQSCLTRPVLDDPDADGYFAPGSNTNTSWNYQTWTYSEWNGSEWEHKWTKMIEEAEPNPENHVYVVTAEDSIASTPPLGHWQQGFGFCTDGIDNYFSSNNGIGQAFGFAGDTISAFKIGADGIEAFTEGPPANLQGPGYPQGLVMGISGFNGWGWDHGPRAINVDVNGNVWLSWNGIGGATGNFTNFLAVAYTPNEGSNGLGGWFAAAEENEDGGYDNTFMPSGCCVSSPDGQYLYVLKDDYIWENQVAPNEPYTFGVWKCEILPDHKIPLVPIRLTEGPINMNWRSAQRGEIQRVQQ